MWHVLLWGVIVAPLALVVVLRHRSYVSAALSYVSAALLSAFVAIIVALWLVLKGKSSPVLQETVPSAVSISGEWRYWALGVAILIAVVLVVEAVRRFPVMQGGEVWVPTGVLLLALGAHRIYLDAWPWWEHYKWSVTGIVALTLLAWGAVWYTKRRQSGGAAQAGTSSATSQTSAPVPVPSVKKWGVWFGWVVTALVFVGVGYLLWSGTVSALGVVIASYIGALPSSLNGTSLQNIGGAVAMMVFFVAGILLVLAVQYLSKKRKWTQGKIWGVVFVLCVGGLFYWWTEYGGPVHEPRDLWVQAQRLWYHSPTIRNNILMAFGTLCVAKVIFADWLVSTIFTAIVVGIVILFSL